jgi:hypothetical protein
VVGRSEGGSEGREQEEENTGRWYCRNDARARYWEWSEGVRV